MEEEKKKPNILLIALVFVIALWVVVTVFANIFDSSSSDDSTESSYKIETEASTEESVVAESTTEETIVVETTTEEVTTEAPTQAETKASVKRELLSIADSSLVHDSITGNVYLRQDTAERTEDYLYCPYYNSNGKIYKYTDRDFSGIIQSSSAMNGYDFTCVLKQIADSDLFYDKDTLIVYLRQKGRRVSTQYSDSIQEDTYMPYYASNSLPYKFNPITNKLYEITE